MSYDLSSELALYLEHHIKMFVPPSRIHKFLTDDFWVSFSLAQQSSLANLSTWRQFEGISAVNPLHSVQYATFLASFSRKLYLQGNTDTSEMISCINKQHCGCEVFGHVPLPFRFLLGHSVGVVLGRCVLNDGLVLFHNTTIGVWREAFPSIGRDVVLMEGSVVAGSSTVGDNSIVPPGVQVVNACIPQNVIAFQGEKRTLVFAENTTNFAQDLSSTRS